LQRATQTRRPADSIGECNTINTLQKAVMKRITRFTPQERKELWCRWKQGQTLKEIGEALWMRSRHSVYSVLRSAGGVAPRERCRAERHLSVFEREEVSRGLVAGLSIREIARGLQRSASTISREIERNGGRDKYRAAAAEERAWRCAERPKTYVLATNDPLRRIVAEKLQQDWSPQQIAGWLKVDQNDPAMHVSHETIYRSLFIQARGLLKKELLKHLRSGRSMRHGKSSTPKGRPYGISDKVSIRERPAEAEDRAVPGHWEGDLIAGANESYVATLVERHSRFVSLLRLDKKTSANLIDALTDHVRELPNGFMRSLTWDQGSEMARHKQFTLATDVQVYFCDPRSPWQRGSNENTNGLLRYYLPRGADLSRFSQQELNAVADRLNTRPRKTLGYITPAHKLAQSMLP
jgi:IS30 family transposase